MTTEQRINQIGNEIIHEVMTKQEFVSYMENLCNGSHTFGSVVSVTEPKMNKTGNPYYNRVKKMSKWNFGCNTSFTTKGENYREKNDIQGDFQAQSTYVQSTNGKENYVVCAKKDNPNILSS